MKLIIIYGPPAVGKLTVGEELSKLTGIKLFHNHMTADFGQEFFPFASRGYTQIVDGTRMVVFEAAARHDLDLIFTYVYAPLVDEPYVDDIEGIVKEVGGEVHFVRLHAPAEVLEQRVILEDRQRFKKLNSAEKLRQIMAYHDLFTEIPGRESLSLDTSKLSPQESARLIAEHFGFPLT